MKALIFFLVFVVVSPSCFAQVEGPPRGGKVSKEYDRFKDSTTVTLDVLLDGEYPQGLSLRAVQIFSGERPSTEPSKLIFAFISAGDELEYAILHDLIFLADGERFKIDSSVHTKQWARNGYVELVLIAIPMHVVRSVATARKVEAQLGNTEFEVTDQQKESLRQFLEAVTPRAKPAEAENPAATQALQSYLRSGFGMPGYETTWYGSIKSVSVRGTIAEAYTDRPEADYKARSICGVVSGFVFSNTNRSLGLTGVRVYGDKGQLVIDRAKLADPCQ